jgi:hypothetical protein
LFGSLLQQVFALVTQFLLKLYVSCSICLYH